MENMPASGPQVSFNSSEESANKIGKIYFFGMMFLVVLVGIAFGLYVFKQPKVSKVVIAPPVKIQEEMPVSDMAKETLQYIDSQKRPDGENNFFAHSSENCTKLPCPATKHPISNSWTALAYYAGYKLFNDNSYKEKAISDIERLTRFCQKDMKRCLWGIVQPATAYQDTKDERILPFLTKAGEELLVYPGQDNLMLVSTEARSLVLLYDVTKDAKFLTAAETRLAKAKTLLIKSQDKANYQASSDPTQVCWYALASAEMAKYSQKPEYVQDALSIVQKGSTYNTEKLIFPMNIEPCIETLFMLGKLTGNDALYKEAKKNLTDFTNNYWDSKKKNKVWGEGGITPVSMDAPIDSPGLLKQVNLSDTSYFVYLLLLSKK